MGWLVKACTRYETGDATEDDDDMDTSDEDDSGLADQDGEHHSECPVATWMAK